MRKHSDDYFFLKHALEHPRRTRNPDEATLFIVGGLLNIIVEQGVWSSMQCCVGKVCNDALMKQLEQNIAASPWFARS